MHRLQTFLWHSSHCCFLLKNILNLVLVQWKQIFPFSIWALRSGSHKLSSLLRDKALRMCMSSSWDKVRVGVDFSAWKIFKKRFRNLHLGNQNGLHCLWFATRDKLKGMGCSINVKIIQWSTEPGKHQTKPHWFISKKDLDFVKDF